MVDKESSGKSTGKLDYIDKGEQFTTQKQFNVKRGIRRLAFVVWFISLFFALIFFFSADRLSKVIPDEILVTILLFLVVFPWPFYFLGNWVIHGFGWEISEKKLLTMFLALILVVIFFLIGLLHVLIKLPKSVSPW